MLEQVNRYKAGVRLNEILDADPRKKSSSKHCSNHIRDMFSVMRLLSVIKLMGKPYANTLAKLYLQEQKRLISESPALSNGVKTHLQNVIVAIYRENFLRIE